MSKNERYRLRPQGLPLPPYIVIVNRFVNQPRILFQYRISRRYDDRRQDRSSSLEWKKIREDFFLFSRATAEERESKGVEKELVEWRVIDRY